MLKSGKKKTASHEEQDESDQENSCYKKIPPTIDCLCTRMIRVEPPYLLDLNFLSLFMNMCSKYQPDASQKSQWIATGSSNILERVILTRNSTHLCFHSMLWVDISACLLLFWFHIYVLLCFLFLLSMQLVFLSSHLKKINKIEPFCSHPTPSKNFTLLISTIRPVYLLYAFTIGHISDSDDLKCYHNTHVCSRLMHPPPRLPNAWSRCAAIFCILFLHVLLYGPLHKCRYDTFWN